MLSHQSTISLATRLSRTSARSHFDSQFGALLNCRWSVLHFRSSRGSTTLSIRRNSTTFSGLIKKKDRSDARNSWYHQYVAIRCLAMKNVRKSGGNKMKKTTKKSSKQGSSNKPNDNSSMSRRRKGETAKERTRRNAMQEDNRSAPADRLDADAIRTAIAAVPPVMLVPTGSPHVYISKLAAVRGQLDPARLFVTHQIQQATSYSSNDETVPASPSTLSSHSWHYPAFFTSSGSGQFEAFAPVDFQYALPTATIPEVAVLGRSNVGKSSLLNAIMRRPLARTSKRPGRTQQAYFYGWIPSKTISRNEPPNARSALAYFLDLPGYGYAIGPEKAVDAWQEATQTVLLKRRDSGHLQRLYLLLDASVGATPLDWTVMQWIQDAEIPVTAVLTKADRTSKSTLVKHLNHVCMRYHHLVDEAEMQQYEDDGDELESSDDDDDRFGRSDNDDDDNISDHDDDESDEEDGGDDDAAELLDTSNDTRVYLSPIVHVTSAKSGAGLTELMQSMTSDFQAYHQRNRTN